MFMQSVERGKFESLTGGREERTCRKSVLPLLWSSPGMFSLLTTAPSFIGGRNVPLQRTFRDYEFLLERRS